MNLIKINWFRILMWGFFLLIVFSVSYRILSDDYYCTLDDIYDWSCDIE